jgi:predicted transcriptional regulator
MRTTTIGEQELALLRHIADRGSLSVGDAAEQFGAPRGLARSTVLTMMERLRRKGLLARRITDGVYRYHTRASSADLLKGAVGRFVERSLNGSVSPFLAYLSEAGAVTDDELRELETLVERLKDGRAEGRNDGKTEGRKDGKAEGRKDGKTEGRKDGRANQD